MAIKFGTLDISKILFGSNQEVAKIFFGSAVNPVYQNAPSFSSSTWTFINQVAIAGQSANFWAVGDTKEDTGTDNNTRVFRVADLSGMYGKDIVIEQVNLVGSRVIWNPSTNTDDDNCYNNYGISDMRTTVLPATILLLSSELQNALTNTTYKVAKNGTSSTLLELTDKLFLPAEKEVGYTSYSGTVEQNALTTWQYWTTHTSNSDHIKKDTGGTARAYWLRSPYFGYTNGVCFVDVSGYANISGAYISNRFAPCFTLGLVVDATLGNNSWDTIRAVAEKGDAANYWAVGDIKNDTGTDSNTRAFRISDMQGLYSKHIVFESVGLEPTTYRWNENTNVDDNNAYNNYSITNTAGNMRYNLNTTVKALLSTELQNALTQTTFKVAKNGNSSTILDVTDYLFIAAGKEVGYTSYSRTEENNALTTWQYWTTHTSANDHIKKDTGGTARAYWLRSPYSGNTGNVCRVDDNGRAYDNSAYVSGRFAPCFSF